MADQAPRFGLTIDPPRAGWVEVVLSLGSAEHRFTPSYLSDAVGDLALAAAALAERSCGWGGQSRFDWRDEPGAWRWRLTPDGGRLHILVERHNTDLPGPDAPGEPVLSWTVPGRRFCSAVLRALDALHDRTPPTRYAQEWRRPFPDHAGERLRAALRAWE